MIAGVSVRVLTMAALLAAGVSVARADYRSASEWFSGKPKKERVLIQDALIELGLYDGRADGVFGGETFRALMDFEDDVDADGVLSASQQAALIAGEAGGGEDRDNESYASWSGSGIAISDETILTNFHVVDGCEIMKVPGFGKASVVSTDERNDLAVIHVDDRLPASATVQADPIELGQAIVALGYPLADVMGDALTVSPGVVASLTGLGGDKTNFTVSANIQPGNSGGPILDLDGNVVGVAVAKLDEAEMLRTAGTTAGPVGFAINSDTVMDFLSSFKVAVADTPVNPAGSVQKAVARAKAFTHQILCEGVE
jgi:S1-C subfamily serine protease